VGMCVVACRENSRRQHDIQANGARDGAGISYS